MASDRLDYEIEIGAVIGREGRDVAAKDGLSHIVGFTLLNDWSARDLQFDEMQCWLGPAKGKDAATSLGPWITTTDELGPWLCDGRLHVQCSVRVNGELWMNGDGGTMHHTWGSLVERASKDSRIVPGDVFGSGTVGGGTVGEAIKNGFPGARYLRPGDVVEMEMEALGVLRNTIAPKAKPDADYPFKAPPASSADAPL